MRLTVLALIGLVFNLYSTEASVNFESCGTSTIGTVTNVDISGCDQKTTCKLIRGSNATLAITFQTKSAVQEVNSVVHGVLHGLPVPFNFPYPDACTYGGLKCPLAANAPLLYTASLPILKSYPRISVKIQWQLQDKDENDVFCIQIPTVLH